VKPAELKTYTVEEILEPASHLLWGILRHKAQG
jgi:hypothetical protein